MKTRQLPIIHKFTCIATLVAMILFAGVAAGHAQSRTYKVIHEFTGTGTSNNGDGQYPRGDLIADSAGNLYGTNSQGGNYTDNCESDEVGCGSVFELSPNSGGGYTATVLYKFNGEPDGSSPWAGLVFDSAGNLYGTTSSGGQYNTGAVYELSPAAGGGWTEKIIYSFLGGTDGGDPTSKLIIDAAGNLYGTTVWDCCSTEGGTIFELSPSSDGNWSFTVLYNFAGGSTGFAPVSGLVRDSAGNLYGTALDAGSTSKLCLIGQYDGCGVVFELSPNSSGGWTYNVLQTFDDFDGALPRASLILDASGNLYGTTSSGGNARWFGYGGFGVVFELSPNSVGGWTEKVLHVFCANPSAGCTDGDTPAADLAFDSAGNLYGTTVYGGTGYGNVFELSPKGTTSQWSFKTIHEFSNSSGGSEKGGIYPEAGFYINASGDIFGTALEGGTGPGVAFEITP